MLVTYVGVFYLFLFHNQLTVECKLKNETNYKKGDYEFATPNLTTRRSLKKFTLGYGCDPECMKKEEIRQLLLKLNFTNCTECPEIVRNRSSIQTTTKDYQKTILPNENEPSTENKNDTKMNCYEKCNKNKNSLKDFDKLCDLQCKINKTSSGNNSTEGFSNTKVALVDSIAKFITFDREYANRIYSKSFRNRFF